MECEELGSTRPPNAGKPDRGVKNEPGRVGARKARKIKSNLDPDLKGIRPRGARHLNILSTACHAGPASSVCNEGMSGPGNWFPGHYPPVSSLRHRHDPIKCHTLLGWRPGELLWLCPERSEERLFLEQSGASQSPTCTVNTGTELMNYLRQSSFVINSSHPQTHPPTLHF